MYVVIVFLSHCVFMNQSSRFLACLYLLYRSTLSSFFWSRLCVFVPVCLPLSACLSVKVLPSSQHMSHNIDEIHPKELRDIVEVCALNRRYVIDTVVLLSRSS